MKATIEANGCMVISPENDVEAFALRSWCKFKDDERNDLPSDLIIRKDVPAGPQAKEPDPAPKRNKPCHNCGGTNGRHAEGCFMDAWAGPSARAVGEDTVIDE